MKKRKDLLRKMMALAAIISLSFVGVVALSAPANASVIGDDYPSSLAAPHAIDSVVDSWGEYNRECTSFVAWRLSSQNGFTMPFHDNAGGWKADAQARGYTVDDNPAVGSVAWNSGHVAWVAAVPSSTTVTLEDYNHYISGTSGPTDGAYHTETVATSTYQYIHFKDMSSSGSSLADGSYILASDTGHVYEMAGGSPIYVSSWSNVPTPHTTSTTYTQAQINAMPQYPKDGTVIRGYTTGAIYVVAGGFPFAVSNLSNVPYTTWTNVDASSLGQLRSQPADGTVIRNYGNGAIYVVSGGAAMGVSSLSNIPYTSWTNVDGWSIGNQLSSVPSNGTTFVDYSTGIVYVVANGFPFAVSSFSNIPPVGGLAYLDHWVLANQLRSTPPNGTVVRDYNSGAIYVVAGDSAISVHTLSSVPYTTWTNIDASYAIPDQLANYPVSGTYLEGYNSGDTFMSNGVSIAPATANSSSVVVDDYAIVNQLGGTE